MGVLLSGVKNKKLDALNPAAPVNSQQSEHQHKARRIRGGGAGRVRLLPPFSVLLPSAPLAFTGVAPFIIFPPDADSRFSPFLPYSIQDCFIGLIECFICFGTSIFHSVINDGVNLTAKPPDLSHRMLQGSSFFVACPSLPRGGWLAALLSPFEFKFDFHF